MGVLNFDRNLHIFRFLTVTLYKKEREREITRDNRLKTANFDRKSHNMADFDRKTHI